MNRSDMSPKAKIKESVKFIDGLMRLCSNRSGKDRNAFLADLLTDLRHWSDYKNVDFDKGLECARVHYEAELIEWDFRV